MRWHGQQVNRLVYSKVGTSFLYESSGKSVFSIGDSGNRTGKIPERPVILTRCGTSREGIVLTSGVGRQRFLSGVDYIGGNNFATK
jgi:hypothetical protein